MPQPPELIVTTREELAACCAHIASVPAFGFDTEFIGEQTYHPRLCLVQAATHERLFIIDPLAIEDLRPFWELVADGDRTAVVHAGREETRMCRHHLGRVPTNLFDLQVAAGLIGAGYPVGHGSLVQMLLRVRLNKGETLTDWSRRPLTRHQIRYAFDDVRYLLPLYDKIRLRLEKLNRVAWVDEEMSMMQSRWIEDDPEREPWRKLRGLGNLNRHQLAVVREVFAWRAERAAIVNKPARYLLRDDLIVELARRKPLSEKDLSVVRGVTRHDIPGLLAAIGRGIETATEALPAQTERESDPPQVAIVTGMLQAVLASFCAEQQLTPTVVATISELKTLVRSLAGESDMLGNSPLFSGWRAAHVLPVLMDVLHGRRGIAVANVNHASPLSLELRQCT